jgi:hypothetical protein
MFFGSMVFKPVRAQREPPGTDRVLNWAAYGLYQDQNYHLLSDKEVADKKKLDKAASNLLYSRSPKSKETMRRYRASEVGKEIKRRYEASDHGKEAMRRYAANDHGKEAMRRYAASDHGKETMRRYAASDHGKETMRRYAASEVGKESKRKSAVSEVNKESKRKSEARQGEQGTKRARLLLETFHTSRRPAVQQKTNEPQLGCLATLLGGSC